MRARYLAPSAIALAVGLHVTSVGSRQELDEHLLLLEPLTGVTWLGHFVESPDSGLIRVVRWEPVLNGAVIRSTKEVTTLNFRMETLYCWDWEKEEISFLQLTSRGIFSRGTVAIAEDGMTLCGRSIRPNGVAEFKQTFEIRPDGTLHDYFYHRDDGEWKLGHRIVYSRQERPNG
jgi:hypothetical protein